MMGIPEINLPLPAGLSSLNLFGGEAWMTEELRLLKAEAGGRLLRFSCSPVLAILSGGNSH